MSDTIRKKALNHKDFLLTRIKAIQDENSIIYMSGSILEGFGNVSSDIDVFVICEELPNSDQILLEGNQHDGEISLYTSQTLIHNFIIDGLRFDVEYREFREVNRIVEKLNNINFFEDYHRNRLNSDEMDFIHRLKYGEPIYNEESFRSMLKNVNFEKLSYIQAIIYSEQYSSFLEDIQGSMESKDYGTTYLLGEIILETSINQYLSVQGETNPSRKWLFRKLERYLKYNPEQKLIINKFLDFKSYKFDSTTIEEHILELLNFTQSINDKVQSKLRLLQLNKKEISI